MLKIKNQLKKQLEESIITHQEILKMSKDINDVIQIIIKRLKKGGKILFCGNGGSAADAQHLVAEFIVRLRPHINRSGIPAIPLTLDSSSITACSNDYSYEEYFERMVQTLGSPGDVLLGITTSGNSENIIKSLKKAKEMELVCLGFLGNNGGEALKYCDKSFVVPSSNTGRIQEVHITAGHALMELIEDGLIYKKFI